MLHFFNSDYDYATRIDIGKFISFDDNIPSIVNSWLIAKIKQISDFNYFTVTKESGFSDYVSCNNYNNEHGYWWVIKIFNDILEENEIKEGTVLKIPTMRAINNLLAEIKTKQTLYNKDKYASIDVYK